MDKKAAKKGGEERKPRSVSKGDAAAVEEKKKRTSTSKGPATAPVEKKKGGKADAASEDVASLRSELSEFQKMIEQQNKSVEELKQLAEKLKREKEEAEAKAKAEAKTTAKANASAA